MLLPAPQQATGPGAMYPLRSQLPKPEALGSLCTYENLTALPVTLTLSWRLPLS
jgi:hypothetical protein